ncbi:arsinothricin resistance N-acetyltransferase ArsN1 family A [Niallia sp. 03133]|uniref:arsinothricin resistance N-acetyltransferase ArsN1 family A n=1 Tax=Niallia sp. 03133 TaxID=3458060 RepID=UPI004043C00B
MIRKVTEADLQDILTIYNQGIADRTATFEKDQKDESYITNWFEKHQNRYIAMLAENEEGTVVGWASINQYNARSAYDGVGELSIYIHRNHRGKGIGESLLTELEKYAVSNQFHKFVLFTFPFNKLGQGLYHKMNYREVGIFKKQGMIDGQFVDVMIMEKLFLPSEA